MRIGEIQSFLEYYERIRKRTLAVAARIPPDRLEWTYQAHKFTLGDILRHLAATERYMFVENVCGRSSSYPGHGRELADGHEAVFRFLTDTHHQSVALLKTLTPEDLQKKCTTPGGVAITAWKWLRAMVEHEAHHRGQIYLYLSMLGIATPPLYGLTSEEVRERSEP